MCVHAHVHVHVYTCTCSFISASSAVMVGLCEPFKECHMHTAYPLVRLSAVTPTALHVHPFMASLPPYLPQPPTSHHLNLPPLVSLHVPQSPTGSSLNLPPPSISPNYLPPFSISFLSLPPSSPLSTFSPPLNLPLLPQPPFPRSTSLNLTLSFSLSTEGRMCDCITDCCLPEQTVSQLPLVVALGGPSGSPERERKKVGE